MDRIDLLISSVLGVCKLRDRWQESGAPRITNEFAEAMDDLVELWDDGDIPGETRPLYAYFPTLRHEWVRFGEYASEKHTKPVQAFWDVLRVMESLLLARDDNWEPPILETVLELRDEQDVSYRQICFMYSHKGVGPFMRNKEPVTALAMKQYKFEKWMSKPEKDRGPKPEHAEQVLPTGFVNPAVTAILNASKRVEKRLMERAARLLGVTGASAEAAGEEILDELPPTRAELDGETLPEEPNPLAAQVEASDNAELAANILCLKDQNQNVSNRDLADTLGCSIEKVKEVIKNRSRQPV